MNREEVTNNIKVPNKDLEILRENFPHCFDKHGNFQLEKFKTILSEKEINFSNESYSLDWLGKSYARLLASEPANTLLKADEKHNAKPENINSENLLIKGDNLEVLKHLSNAYYEKIKMIYIDPPYNTGSDDFVYEDDRKFTVRELQQLTGVDEEKAKRILEFTRSKSNSHSAWLTFMYPRLYLAKRLLREDGAIFISIDDNEVAQLKLLMDEVFGEENFVGQITWKNVTDNNPTNIAIEHEYIIVYCKYNLSLVSEWKSRYDNLKDILIQVGIDLLNKYSDNQDLLQKEYTKWFRENKSSLGPLDRYKYIDKDGIYTGSQSVHNPNKEGYRYDVVHPVTKKPCKEPLRGYRFPRTTMDDLLSKGKILFGPDETKIIELKVGVSEYEHKFASTIELDGRLGAYDLSALFSDKIFNNPKPITLLKDFFSFVLHDNDIILDFFAGSGTTGHAVMKLNAEDGANRKYIMVQIAEPIDSKKNKTAYDFVADELKAEPTIFEITKERLLRAARKIKEKNSKHYLDLGFKIFETMPIWEDYEFEAERFENTQTLFDVGKLTIEDTGALITTWKTYDGMLLSKELEAIDLDTYTAHYGHNKLYLMNKGFSTVHLKSLLERIDTDKNFNPTSIIAFGHHFESKSLRELTENIKSYANKKNIDIEFTVRY